MNQDYTQQQSLDGLQRSEQMSLRATVPPAEIPGYKIDKLLGQGAFGQVWLGIDLNTGRAVAIKFYQHRGGVNWSLINREVNHLVNMSTGRYIVQVLSVGWEADPPYYIMEYLENGSLEDLIRAKGALDLTEAVDMFREIADGLSFAHGKGVLHCDLKPANVVLDHDHRPRLADFGQSRMSDEQTPSLGTLFYMAPEQADLEASPDAAWDVYALGAIAYAMLVGSPPYRTTNVIESLDTSSSLPERLKIYRETIATAPRPRLHYRRRGIDKGLCQIVDRCLAPKQENRFQNVQQVIGAIDSWKRGRTRRPLYLLGIVGPILLLILMMFFSARSISVARDVALQKVQQRSLESNVYAAKLAARTLEKGLEGLFRAVEDETRRPELQLLLASVVEKNSGSLKQLAVIDSPEDIQMKFIADQTRSELESYLDNRLKLLIQRSSQDEAAAIISSLFINERQGTNVSTVFSRPLSQSGSSPVAKNFAYRSYFTGARADAPGSTPRDQFSPTRRMHLSASFRSTSTGKMKVGISAPIWPEDYVADHASDPPTDVEPLGVLVLTINLGDFDLLNEPWDISQSRFAALVDGRDGPQKGWLLQHPLLQATEEAVLRRSPIPHMDERQIAKLQSSEGVVDYIDPAAEWESGKRFEGKWIAAMHQVGLPGRAGGGANAMSDLWVLVQERAISVEAPLNDLGWQLQIESYLELAVFLAVIFTLWFFVLRVGLSNQSSGGIAAAGKGSLVGPTLNSTADHES